MMGTFGEYLRELRLARGLTLRETGRITGLSNSFISMIENGERQATSVKTLSKLADAYQVMRFHLWLYADRVADDQH